VSGRIKSPTWSTPLSAFSRAFLAFDSLIISVPEATDKKSPHL